MFMSMEDINKTFQAALEHFLTKRGDQAALADRTDVSTSHINDILKGRRGGTEEKRRALAAALGYPGRHYEDFLDLGRAICAGRPLPEPPADGLNEADLAATGYFQIPLNQTSQPAGLQGQKTAAEAVVVHGSTLGVKSGRHLRAFTVGGDSMEPLLAQGGLVVADLTKNRAENLKDGSIYVLRYDGGEAVKFLCWAEKGKLLALESENKSYKPVFRRVKEVILIGRVIWSCRAHK
jgi:transcriptional regulator with XRE-family HTH domain